MVSVCEGLEPSGKVKSPGQTPARPDPPSLQLKAMTGAPVMAFTCNDGGSGLAGVCPGDFTFPEGSNPSHTETIYDVAGNSSSSGETGINVDITAPSLTHT